MKMPRLVLVKLTPLEKNNNLTEFILILKEQHNFFLSPRKKKNLSLVNFFSHQSTTLIAALPPNLLIFLFEFLHYTTHV